MDEEKTRQDIEDIINSIHEPSLDIQDHSFSSYSDQPSPTTPRNRYVSVTSLPIVSSSCFVCVQITRVCDMVMDIVLFLEANRYKRDSEYVIKLCK